MNCKQVMSKSFSVHSILHEYFYCYVIFINIAFMAYSPSFIFIFMT